MRTLLIGALAASLAACTCLPPLAVTDTCPSSNCSRRTAAVEPASEVEPAPFTPRPAKTKVKSATPAKAPKLAALAAKKEKPASIQMPNSSGGPGEQAPAKAKPAEPTTPGQAAAPTPATTVGIKTESAAAGQPSETSDMVLKRARNAVAARMEDPTSAEIEDMKRAARKNTFGQPIDTICGHVKGKKLSGEDTGTRPFLYLVKEDEAYVVGDNPDSLAAIAYGNICGTDSRVKSIRRHQSEQ